MSSNCGLPEYHGESPGVVVYAAKITDTQTLEHYPGAVRLVFGDLDKHADVLPYWAVRNSPQTGGYFVVPETGGAAFMHAQQFEATFTRA